MTWKKVLLHLSKYLMMTCILSTRMEDTTVTGCNLSVLEKYIEESSKITKKSAMGSLSFSMKMSMTANGRVSESMEKECSRRHKLEELKEDFMKMMYSRKSLKS